MVLLGLILLSFAAALGIVLLGYLFLSLFAYHEIQTSKEVKISENCVKIFANPDSLEYDIRCSMLACPGRDVVFVVCLDPADRHFDEMLSLARSFAAQYGNVRLELTEKERI